MTPNKAVSTTPRLKLLRQNERVAFGTHVFPRVFASRHSASVANRGHARHQVPPAAPGRPRAIESGTTHPGCLGPPRSFQQFFRPWGVIFRSSPLGRTRVASTPRGDAFGGRPNTEIAPGEAGGLWAWQRRM